MLWHHYARVNSHQRWKQTRFRVCFHLWCELTSTMSVTEWQVSWNSYIVFIKYQFTIQSCNTSLISYIKFQNHEHSKPFWLNLFVCFFPFSNLIWEQSIKRLLLHVVSDRISNWSTWPEQYEIQKFLFSYSWTSPQD